MTSPTPSCKKKDCDRPRYTRVPLGTCVFCKTHFTQLTPEKKEVSVCQWGLGCDKATVSYAGLHLTHCAAHIEYTMTTLSLKRIEDLRNNHRQASDTCAYTYREPRYGYKTGTVCKRSKTTAYCSLHQEEMEAVLRCVAQLKHSFSPYLQAVEKKVVLSVGNREEYCRTVFNKLTGYEFPRARPKWLKHERTRRCLELDGYCEELGVAFEHDGEHHYTWPNTFHKTEKDYLEQKDRDAIKEGLCSRRGITLVRIRQDVPADKIEELIRKSLDEHQAMREAIMFSSVS